MADKKRGKQQVEKDWGAIADKLNEIPLDDNNDFDEDDEVPKNKTKNQEALAHPDYSELEETLTKTEQEKQKYYSEILRLNAEIDNQRKRNEMRVKEAYDYSIEKFVKELLPVIDSLEIALEQKEIKDESIKKMREGVDLTLKMFLDTLKKFGVTVIHPQNKPFDPKYHEAISAQDPPEGVESNMVLHVFQKGYSLNDRLLRPARVVVAK